MAAAWFGFSSNLHRIKPVCRRVLAQPVDKSQRLAVKRRLGVEPDRIDQDGEHAVDDRTALSGRLVSGAVPGQGAAQQPAGHGQAIASVLAKRLSAPKPPFACGTTTPGSMVGWSRSFINRPGGTDFPWLCATLLLPRPTRLVVKSSTKGGWSFSGIQMQHGLVP